MAKSNTGNDCFMDSVSLSKIIRVIDDYYPATFMTAVSATYTLQANEGFRLSTTIASLAYIAIAVLYFPFGKRQ